MSPTISMQNHFQENNFLDVINPGAYNWFQSELILWLKYGHIF